MQHPDINVNSRDNDGATPLHRAMQNLNYNCQKLLDHPLIDVNCIDDIGETPLHKATRIRNLTGVRILLNHPCIDLIYQKNHDNRTALDLIEESIQDPNFQMMDHFMFGGTAIPVCFEIKRLIEEEFPIKRRWDAYQYFLSNVVELMS